MHGQSLFRNCAPGKGGSRSEHCAYAAWRAWAWAPKHFLLLRRMNLARQALQRADTEATRATEIAAGFGFWKFGRFSVEYKVLFGESPSTTLRNVTHCST